MNMNMKPSKVMLAMVSILLCLMFAFLPGCVSSQKVSADGDEIGSIHAIEWTENKDRASTDEKAPEGLLPQPLVKRAAEVLRKRVVGFHPHWAGASYHNYKFDLLTTVFYFSFDVDTATGKAADMHSWRTTNLLNAAHLGGVRVALAATNFGGKCNSAILRSPERRQTLIKELVSAVAMRDADGVHVDFESVCGADRDNLVLFMTDLSAAFHKAFVETEVSMAIPAVDWSHAYDVVELAKVCEYLILMGYDFHYRRSDRAGAVAPLAGGELNITRAVCTYLDQSLPSGQLVLGVPYYGYSWPTDGCTRCCRTTGPADSKPVKYSSHKSMTLEQESFWDNNTSSPWYIYRLEDQWHQAWFDDSTSLSMKYRLVDSLSLGGVSIWALSYDYPESELWKCLRTAFSVEPAIGK
jgi:spore germination protein YaaH